jgi:hypothetical protein
MLYRPSHPPEISTLGVSLDRIVSLFDRGYVAAGARRVLDIGCSNLHTIDPEMAKAFVTRFNDIYDPAALDRWARFIAAGGAMDREIGGINGAWLGDLLQRAGFEYTAFDIFSGFNTTYFDLNQQELDEEHRGRFDLVLNFGTTEHVLGQFNAFKVIHEATAIGGIMYHDLPMTGHLDHGFYNYNPVLLVSLAEANGYEVIHLSFAGGFGGEAVNSHLISRYNQRPFFEHASEAPEWLAHQLPTASLSFIARKLHDAPFRASLETSTTVGAVVEDIDRRYGVAQDSPAARQAEALGRVHALLTRLHDSELSLDEMNEAYRLFIEAGLHRGFPLSLEMAILQRTLETSPDAGLAERRDKVFALLRQERPLLKSLDAGEDAGVDAGALALDGVEAAFDEGGDPETLQRRILAAYRVYHEKLAVELFPVRLEAIALEHLSRRGGRDVDRLVRIGQVMAEVTPGLEVARRLETVA